MSTALVEIAYGDVKQSIETAKAHLEKAAEQVVWQIENRVWTVLGYDSWNEMREAEYGGAAFMVPKAERPELVARMRAQGLTQQEIADTAGVAEATVRNDLNRKTAVEVGGTITNSRGQQRPATYAPRYTPDADVAEFPVLAYYVETGRAADVEHMAGDLRRYRDRGELDERLDTLRRSIAVDRAKRDGTYRPTPAVNTETGEVSDDYLPDDATGEEVTPSAEATDTDCRPVVLADDVEEAPGEGVEPVLSAAPSRPAVTAHHCPTCTCTHEEN